MALRARFIGENFASLGLIPTFLCPALMRPTSWPSSISKRQVRIQRRQNNVQVDTLPLDRPETVHTLLALPLQCPGCGAYTHSNNPHDAGYYSVSRKTVKSYIRRHRNLHGAGSAIEGAAFNDIAKQADIGVLEALGLTRDPSSNGTPEAQPEVATPVCNRCHDLLHHHVGVSIIHPTLQSIQDIISESPYKYNHVYHVLDAADFPLSLIPRLQHHLSLSPQRSFNRRSKKSKYLHGRKAEMSFIVTRSDLLAPKKEQVDGLMPYLTQVLRDALGSSGRDVRLGNVRCVSSKRGWWTKEVKEAVWERGGGGWMVGKVNVGKSNLFECIFPKGRIQEINFHDLRNAAIQDACTTTTISEVPEGGSPAPEPKIPLLERSESNEGDSLSENYLLPPAPREERYPVMPIVSSLPGTTASPIRLLFGGGKGELIDLPGLARGDLEQHVSEDLRQDLVMRQRVKPEKFSIKSGQSLLLGGIIRITPITPDIVLLAFPFVPLDGHVTSTEKAIAIQTQQQPSGIPSMAKPGVGELMALAGRYQLDYDVTKQRAGPLTAPAAVGLKTHVLPFIVYSIDILIEGCGWVELVAQVRRTDIESRTRIAENGERGAVFPEVEVFSPNGKHVGCRRPMNGWLLGGEKPASMTRKTARPRRSMKGVKKNTKRLVRAR